MKNFIRKTLAFSLCLAFASLSFSLSIFHVPQAFAGDSTVQEKNLTASGSQDSSSATDAGASSVEQKGGIYKVGRGFKTAGSGMKKGFVKAGHGFSWLGHKFKNFFTGKSDNKETAENTITPSSQKSHLDQVGDDPQQSQTATDAKN